MRRACLIALIFAAVFDASFCRAEEIVLPKAEGPVAVDGPWETSYSDPVGAGNAAAEPHNWHPLGLMVPPIIRLDRKSYGCERP